MHTTHWHLVRTEWATIDRARFDWDNLRTEPTHGIASSPAEVVAWVIAQKRAIIAGEPALAAQSGLDSIAGWVMFEETVLHRAELGDDVLSVQALNGRQIVHLDAWARDDTCECTAGAGAVS